ILLWQGHQASVVDAKRTARSNLEASLMRSLGSPATDVIGLLNDAQRLDPTLVEVYLQRGLLYFNTDRSDQALRDFETGLKLAPDDAALRFARGTVLRFLGREDEAKAALANLDLTKVADPRQLM